MEEACIYKQKREIGKREKGTGEKQKAMHIVEENKIPAQTFCAYAYSAKRRFSAKIGSICEEVRESGNEMYLCVVSSKENDGTKLKSPLVYYYYSLFCEKLYFHMSYFF